MGRLSASTLEGQALDDAVALALGWKTYPDDVEGRYYWYMDATRAPYGPRTEKAFWNPSTHQGQGGNLIDEYQIATRPVLDKWEAHLVFKGSDGVMIYGIYEYGTTRLEAAMRVLLRHLHKQKEGF